ncbi:ABC transporter permease [Staphylococcus massiliensis]|uniref:FtsX-like permease family protein n=1 Tax=Staphylococcus massiliensis TaxID=555791 RepID=UPI001EDF7679|nr:ABC transporter permease [Staphylococcus massiliensis]
MPLKLLSKLVFKNFKALSKTMIPFIISASVMFGIEYIIISLINNDYLQQRHENLPMLMRFSSVIVTLLVLIFVLYAHRFVMKQRKQEFALNMTLGMERKHIRLLIFMELILQFAIIAFLSILGGYLFGNLVFLFLNTLVQDSGIKLMNYPFDVNAMIIVLIMLGVTLVFLYVISHIQITMQKPSQLFSTKRSGEKKSRKVMIIIYFVIGAIALGYGYVIGVTTEGGMDALTKVFLGVLAVMVGTYFLFMSLTILVLQFLQKRKRFYYKQKHFFFISGMLPRMRSNAVGLASITMLCTFVIVTLGMALTTYRGIETQIDHAMFNDYETTFDGNYKKDRQIAKQIDNFEKDINQYEPDVDVKRLISVNAPMVHLDGDFKPMLPKYQEQTSSKNYMYSYVVTEEGFNALKDTNLHLKDGEVAVSSNAKRFKNFDNIRLKDQTYHVKHLKGDYVGSNIAIDSLYIVVKDEAELYKMNDFYTSYNFKAGEKQDSPIYTDIAFDVKGDHKALDKHIKSFEKKYNIHINQRSETATMLYETNGGLIFLGIVVSAVLLIGMFLIVYYKQISEGMDDKYNYQIMKKVGLSDKQIKRVNQKQILWLFMLPIAVSLIHLAFGFNIIYNLISVLGIREISLFLTSYLFVTLAIIALYGLIYFVTSRKYYQIINQK